MNTLKKFAIFNIITYFTLSLIAASTLQNNNLLQNNFPFFEDIHLQIVYAEHTENGNDKDDDDNNNNKNDNAKVDDDEENAKINFPYEDYFEFTHPKYQSKEDLLSSSSSLEDYYSYLKDYNSYLEKTKPSLSLKDKKQQEEKLSEVEEDSSDTNRDRYSALTGSSDKKSEDSRYSDLVDLSNPQPFSKFQDPIPKQPGQPLHPDLPPTPSLPREPSEPRNPPIPPP
jgi:hypothetical protein